MKHLKKVVPILMGLILILQFTPMEPVKAAESDTFEITVTGEFLWIDITNATWAIGTIAMSASNYTNETGITFIADMDNCSVNADLKLEITSDGADWTACADGETAGADIYRLNASIDIWVAHNVTIVSTGPTTISSGVVAGNNESFDLRFDAPTSTSVSDAQSITVTATITKS